MKLLISCSISKNNCSTPLIGNLIFSINISIEATYQLQLYYFHIQWRLQNSLVDLSRLHLTTNTGKEQKFFQWC
uniref:Uncharacterized protein n=1 Tax=Rhizophora mucronata TaxID=61149 RepID=A0A2P2MKJ0_RHIMU